MAVEKGEGLSKITSPARITGIPTLTVEVCKDPYKDHKRGVFKTQMGPGVVGQVVDFCGVASMVKRSHWNIWGNEGACLALRGCWPVKQEARGTRRGGSAIGTCAQTVAHYPRAGDCA